MESAIVLSSSDEEGAVEPARSRRPRDVEAHVLADFEEVGPGRGRRGLARETVKQLCCLVITADREDRRRV